MFPHPLCTRPDHRLTRRQWLLGTGATGWAWAAHAAFAAQARRQNQQVVFVWLDGGMSQLESWDPKPRTQFGGPFRAIPTSVPGLHISELLPHSAKVMHHLAVVRSLCTKDNAHSSGVARIQRGDPKNRGVEYPFFGAAVAKWLGAGQSGLPPYIWIKPGNGGFIPAEAGFLGPQFGALALGDGQPPENFLRPAHLSADDDRERNALRALADQRYAAGRRGDTVAAQAQVFEMAAQLQRQRHLFDANTFNPKDVARYGTHELGRHLLLARRLIEAGVTFVKVTSYGWDTHGDNFNAHSSLVPQFDQPFAALVSDLAERGLLDRVLIIAMSEFGRTPRINGHLGRDHWPEAWSAAMGGSGLARGAVVGKTNDKGTFVASAEHDIGPLFHTWFRALGLDPAETEYDHGGQPLPLAHDDCGPIAELLPK